MSNRHPVALGLLVVGACMKHLLPGRTEFAILISLAIICSTIVAGSAKVDLALSLTAMPLFLCGALMGMKRSGQLDRRDTAE